MLYNQQRATVALAGIMVGFALLGQCIFWIAGIYNPPPWIIDGSLLQIGTVAMSLLGICAGVEIYYSEMMNKKTDQISRAIAEDFKRLRGY